MIIVKVGGGSAVNLEGVARDLSRSEEPTLVVLGANAERDALAARLGTPRETVVSVSGVSSVLSDVNALDAILMAYAGLRAKRFVELCQRHGVNALSLTGIDGRLVQGKRNAGIRVREGGKTLIKRDLSGKPRSVNSQLLEMLLDADYTPVLTIPIVDEQGAAINSENDDIVNVLAAALAPTCIVQLIEAPGFLATPGDERTLVPRMSLRDLEAREAEVQGRMKRKMMALRKLFETRATKVVLADGRVEHPLRDALAGQGTIIE